MLFTIHYIINISKCLIFIAFLFSEIFYLSVFFYSPHNEYWNSSVVSYFPSVFLSIDIFILAIISIPLLILHQNFHPQSLYYMDKNSNTGINLFTRHFTWVSSRHLKFLFQKPNTFYFPQNMNSLILFSSTLFPNLCTIC